MCIYRRLYMSRFKIGMKTEDMNHLPSQASRLLRGYAW